MSILTKKEREDVYKYWLHSSTLTNEDGLIRLAEKAVLEKLAGMDLPEPEFSREVKYSGIAVNKVVTEHYYTAAQLHQAYAQGAASQLSADPIFFYRPVCNGEMYEGPHYAKSIGGRMLREEKPAEWLPLYTLKAPK